MYKSEYRSWVENGSFSYMNYQIEFIGGEINHIFAKSGLKQNANTRITYMQCSGFKDKFLNKIYSGDIVLFKGNTYEIIFEIGSFMLVKIKNSIDMFKEFKDCWNDNVYPMSQLYWNEDECDNIMHCLEVIGNIYENPELLT